MDICPAAAALVDAGGDRQHARAVGEVVELSKIAPFGCPFAIHVSGYELSLRKEEAACVLVKLVA